MYVVLYEDSSLVWFRDRDAKQAEGSLRLRDSPDLIAAGQVQGRWYGTATGTGGGGAP